MVSLSQSTECPEFTSPLFGKTPHPVSPNPASHLHHTAHCTLPSRCGSRWTRSPGVFLVRFGFQWCSLQGWCIHNEFRNFGHEITTPASAAKIKGHCETEQEPKDGWACKPSHVVAVFPPGVAHSFGGFKTGSFQGHSFISALVSTDTQLGGWSIWKPLVLFHWREDWFRWGIWG